MDSPLAQTEIPNRKLVKTHFFTETLTLFPAECQGSGCVTLQSVLGFEAMSLNCPRPKTRLETCTYEIEFCSQVTVNEASFADAILFRILVDNAPPSPGPVDGGGLYFLERPSIVPVGSLVSHCMTFVDSGNAPGDHVLDVSVGAQDLTGDGASITAGFSKVTVRVYKP